MSVVINDKEKSLQNRQRQKNITGMLFLSPWLFGFIVFTLGPMLISLFLAFTKYDYITEIKWVGLDNFIKMFTNDYHFWNSIVVTFKYVFIREPLKLIFALAVALLLNGVVKGSNFYRTMFYLPTVIGGGVAVSVMWKMVLSKEGMLNMVLGLVNIPPIAWLNDPNITFYSLIMISLYGFGGAMIIFLAGLKDIPASLYEAAEIDGASKIAKFKNITVPLLSPVIFFNLIMGIINGFQTFTSAFVITGGGPIGTTSFYMLNLYSQAFEYYKAGYASALAWILFCIILFFTLIVFKSSNLWVFYEASAKKSESKKQKKKGMI